jgi:hypothetical protein
MMIMTIMMNLKQLNQKLFMYKCSEAILNVILIRLNLNFSIFIIIYEGDYEVKQLTMKQLLLTRVSVRGFTVQC